MFEFDSAKSVGNKFKHGINFIEAQALWLDPDLIEIQANQSNEPRTMVIAKIHGKCWSAIVTHRQERIRLISVRRSRKEEENLYESQITR